MMTNVEERVHQAASDLRRELARVPIPDPPTSRSPNLGWKFIPSLGVAAVVIVALTMLPRDDMDPLATSLPQTTVTTVSTPTTSPTTSVAPTTTTIAIKLPQEGPIFGEETGVLLLLDDGIDGLTALDPDRRLVARSTVEGQRAGDEDYSMYRVGGKLIVGWGVPHAVDIATRQATSLGLATIFVPAAEPGRVWLIDYGDRIGARTPEVWQVDVVSGEVVQPPVEMADGYPMIGISGGLAVQRDLGLGLWMRDTAQSITLDTNGPGFALDVFGDELAWCDGGCTELHLTDTTTLATQHILPPGGYDRFLVSGRYSPNGRFLAVLVGAGEGYEGAAVWIRDRVTGDATVVMDPDTHVNYVAWAPSSDQLFATSASYGGNRTVVWRYDLIDLDFSSVVLPFGGAMSPVVIEVSLGALYFGDDLVDPSRCRAPGMQPSGRSEICTFGL